MGTAQGRQKWYVRFFNHLLCASNDPEAPKKSWGKKCLDCLKPTPDEQPSNQDQGPERETWGNRCTFFITTLGMSVGLGQVWRFPVLAYTYGGAVFLILYGLFIFTFGNVIFFFEVSNGQYTSKNPLKVFDKVPLFIGLGWAMITYAYLFCTYYSHMVAYSFFYLFHSFTSHLPWTYCPDNEDDIYDSYTCMPYTKIRSPQMDGIVCGNEGFIYDQSELCTVENYFDKLKADCCAAANASQGPECNGLFNRSDLCRKRDYPSEYYWNHCVTKSYRRDDPNWGYLGPINWSLLGCSFLSWVIAYLTLYKGIKSLGIIMYIMVPLPYIVLVIMLAVVAPQEGATEGLKEFFVPDMEAFLNVTVWRVATEQAFYSIGVAMGPLITFGSYSKFNSPSHIDGALICLCIFLTSVLCSCVVFSVLGFLSHKTGKKFNDVVEAGPGLVFVVYPEALELLPGAQFFSCLFYVMLINLGLSSVTGIIETVPSAIYDIWPHTRNLKYLVNMGVLFSAFLIGIPITARGGLAVYRAYDTYSAGMTLLPICALELFIVVFIYGLGRFCEDINFMLNFYPNRFYRYQWMTAPFILTAVFIYGIATLSLPPSRVWEKIFGWFLFLCVMIWIPIGMLYTIIKYKKMGKPKDVLKAPPDHGPKNPELLEARKNFSVKRKIF